MFMKTKMVFAAWVAEEGKVNIIFDVNQTTPNVFDFNQIKDLIGYNVEHSGWYMAALQYANVTFEGNNVIAIEPSKHRIDLLLAVL